MNFSGENGLNGSSGDGYGSGSRSPAAYSRPSSAQNSLNRGTSAQSVQKRPSVDDLLDELDRG